MRTFTSSHTSSLCPSLFLLFQFVKWWHTLTRPDQTVSTLWTTNSSCTTRQTMPTTVACSTWREECVQCFSEDWFPGSHLTPKAYLGDRSNLCLVNFLPNVLQNQRTTSAFIWNPGSVLLNLIELCFWDSEECPVKSDWTLLPYVSCRLCWKGTLWVADLSQTVLAITSFT